MERGGCRSGGAVTQSFRIAMEKERNDEPATVDMTIKLVIDTKVPKVLFAESSNDFVEFLFCLLSLPIATVARLFNSYVAGSIGNLHYSFANHLDQTYLQPNLQKNALLNPMIVKSTQPSSITPSSLRFYTCHDPNCKGGVTNVCGGAFCPGCFGEMNQEIQLVATSSGVPDKENESKGNVKEEKEEVVSYVIYDDLTITPMSTTSIASMMNNLDVSILEERNVTFNRKMARELLVASFESTTVLTDVFLGREPEVVDMEKLSSQFAKEMKEAREELESSQSLKERNITGWLTNNQVLHNVRKELMNGFRALPNATDVGIKEMGKIEPIPFWVAYGKKGMKGVDPSLMASSWEDRLKSRDWDPFIMIPKQGKHEEMKKVINEDDTRLKELRSDLGDDVYNAVVKGLTELNEYNPGGSERYGCDEVWNFKEGRKASLNEAIQCLFDNLNTLESSKRSRSM